MTWVVFDTVTLLQGVSFPEGPAGACFRLALARQVGLVMSVDGLYELHEVTGRSEVRDRFPTLTTPILEAFLDSVRDVVRVVASPPPLFRYPRDPGDEHVLNVAIAAGAAFLVTRDRDLLDLMSEGNPDGTAFRRICPGLRIVDPVAFLKAVSPESPNSQV